MGLSAVQMWVGLQHYLDLLYDPKTNAVRVLGGTSKGKYRNTAVLVSCRRPKELQAKDKLAVLCLNRVCLVVIERCLNQFVSENGWPTSPCDRFAVVA